MMSLAKKGLPATGLIPVK
ncbi:Protein of unknown function [Bacillus mycoides]|uniref:Uncharacterized protein n=1 Tax=Bacillus mycoides TaxID=1405 RepID=A0A1G4ETM1_BACMY|nr:Protein of unknown function [Bacillus mycoides]